MQHRATAIVPCNDLNRSERFYGRLGFRRQAESLRADPEASYRMLQDAAGASVHLRAAEPGWVVPGSNPFGLYLYTEAVNELAAEFAQEILEPGKRAEDKPWGMYEFSLSDPDGVLVRVGWPTRLRG